jgi:hypothetical protein
MELISLRVGHVGLGLCYIVRLAGIATTLQTLEDLLRTYFISSKSFRKCVTLEILFAKPKLD